MTFSPTAPSEKPLLVSPLKPILVSKPGERLYWSRLYGSARGLALVHAAWKHPGPLLVITRDVHAAEQLELEIRFYLAGACAVEADFNSKPTLPVLHFPDWECLPYDMVSPHPGIVSERLETLYRLPTLTHGILLTSVSTLMHRVVPREYVTAHSFLLRRGDRLDIADLRRTLTHAGYNAVSQVMEPGEFAVRGGVVDLFPAGNPVPYRLDLFGEEIESIREFDPASQRSGRLLEEIRLLPAREIPLTAEAIQHFRISYRGRFEGDPQRSALYRDVSKGLVPAGVEYYLPLFFSQTATVFDYLPDTTMIFLDSEVPSAARDFEQHVHQRYQDLRHDRERPLLSPHEIILTAEQFQEKLDKKAYIEFLDIQAQESFLRDKTEQIVSYDTLPPPLLPVERKAEQPYRTLFNYLNESATRVLLVAETPGRRETLRELLRAGGHSVTDIATWDAFLKSGIRLGLITANLERGLRIPTLGIDIITEPQLYGERVVQRRRRQSAHDPETIIRNLSQLRIGDPVVHEDHGVGRYLGLQTLDIGDTPNCKTESPVPTGRAEFLVLEYAGGDKLYLPVLNLHLITRYTGTDPEHAPLHKLGSDAWEKAKHKALEKAWDTAAELLDIYAARSARAGYAFPPHDTHYQAFADAFPFEETPDQTRAIREVLIDMESDKPMDRLVCGDVGFGKTEVALRAAFLAVHGGKQVAVLVPTTLLAQQHFQNFCDRFADVPARIGLLSRFLNKNEQQRVAQDLADGTVDIVIGTHRLLQQDIRFKRLGLVIVDEEHRFGVRQKERLKKLRSEVDVLAMTATPIPRTLNLSLASLRDISLITTAPEGRLSVKTTVGEGNKTLLREACLRELRRGGQVYFLHNEVSTIDKAARELKALLPEADIQVAHGQMPERELERIMLDFYHRRFNILVCSTIIESGIDVPTANTIIIERADKFGLSQLHQLRGRVGRSHHRAYAYLLIPGWRAINADARKRLEAIQSIDELGAGFALASHDLEIRGAGELLGDAQSGSIDEIGFTLYADLLSRAVKSLQAGETRRTLEPSARSTEINLHAPTLLPERYLPDVHMRLVLYKRIAECNTLDDVRLLREEVVDRFGPLPEAAQLLFRAGELKTRATGLGIQRIDAGPRGIRIQFINNPPVDPADILRLVQTAPRKYRLEKSGALRVVGEMPDVEMRLQAVYEVMAALQQKS